jgi:hypothetical protein
MQSKIPARDILGSTNLLSIGADAKTSKAWKESGYMIAVMYLAPWKMAGINMCPMAEIADCATGCLGITSGHFAIGKNEKAPYDVTLKDNTCQWAKIKRTRLYADDRALFLARLTYEIERAQKRADKLGLKLAVRLNGTSDLDWTARANGAIVQSFPDVTFYDYTKVMKRAYKDQPANYLLSLSYSAANDNFADTVTRAHYETGLNLVYVYRCNLDKSRAMDDARFLGHTVIDGDLHDMRFLDPSPALVFLRAKGTAKNDRTGFVLDYS